MNRHVTAEPIADLRESHTPSAIRRRLDGGPEQSHLKDFIYGAIDGAVTTFAVVSGVAGAELASSIVIVLGVANLVADGFSMAISNYLGTKAEIEQRERTRLEERHHVETVPDGEREEIRQIFARKGFDGEELERIVATITADENLWIDTMLREEHGLSLESPNAPKAAAATFTAFVLVGSIPLITFVWDALFDATIAEPFFWSALMTAVAFFAVGAAKSRFVSAKWYKSGTETLLIGGLAALLSYLVGMALKGLAG